MVEKDLPKFQIKKGEWYNSKIINTKEIKPCFLTYYHLLLFYNKSTNMIA